MPNMSALSGIPDVALEIGRSRYILVKVHLKDDEETYKYVVRGSVLAANHTEVLEKETAALKAAGLECECLGGGYIIHLPDTKELKVYGNSQTYGQADHAKTTEILKKQYPTYTSITWSNDAIV
ncbi:14 kDa phosphohistidine phosphatase-like [Dermacentor andersoni]|nr:14 kDa phosphohistidine phosphatase-like isoform X1 [Dermacentor andersoni]